jgi:hypothetical protein
MMMPPSITSTTYDSKLRSEQLLLNASHQESMAPVVFFTGKFFCQKENQIREKKKGVILEGFSFQQRERKIK